MRAAKHLVVIFLGTLALLTAGWGGWLLVAGALGRRSEDLGPAFFMVIGVAFLAFAAVLAWLAFLTTRRPTSPWQRSFAMLLALVLGLALFGFVTAVWLGVVVLLGLVVAATALKSFEQSEGGS
jgi:hypothetical protein